MVSASLMYQNYPLLILITIQYMSNVAKIAVLFLPDASIHQLQHTIGSIR